MAHQPGPARLVRRLALGLILLAFAGLLQGRAPAMGAPGDASLSDVFSVLRITPEPSDYVVIVDTSASMTDQNRYQRVRDGLSQMAQALSPDDRVAVITFDATPTIRRPLTAIGTDRGAVVASLPGAPRGQATDIGRAIGGALDLMQGSSLRSRAAVLLLTDGQVDTVPNSPYATVSSPGWNALRQRASALQSSHDIAPLAIALTSNTDAAVLKKVFTDVTDVSATNLGSYLSQVSTEVMKAAATGKLKSHLADPVAASLEWVPGTGTSGASAATLVLHNTNPIVPVRVGGLAVSADVGRLAITGVPASVAVAPGGTWTKDITVTPSGTPAGTTTYHLTGTVSTPWQTVITHDLGLTWSAKLTSTTERVTQPSASPTPAPDPSGTTTNRTGSWGLGIVALLAVLALVALIVVGFRALRGAGGPELTGTLSVLRNGGVVDERLLRGRTASFTLTGPATTVALRGTKNADGQPGVKLSVSVGKDRTHGVLFEGDTLDVAGLVVTYTTDRTRMLRLIGTD